MDAPLSFQRAEIQEFSNMTNQAERRSLRNSWNRKSIALLMFLAVWAALSAFSFATDATKDDGPKPDPTGTATGDKTSVVDASGNSFVVAEPADKARSRLCQE
jgi:hypothetical protein